MTAVELGFRPRVPELVYRPRRTPSLEYRPRAPLLQYLAPGGSKVSLGAGLQNYAGEAGGDIAGAETPRAIETDVAHAPLHTRTKAWLDNIGAEGMPSARVIAATDRFIKAIDAVGWFDYLVLAAPYQDGALVVLQLRT